MKDADIDVVYIGGAARSGTTLLQRLLGTLDGCFPAGELTSIWDFGFVNNYYCSCGQPFQECEFWSAVVREAFGGRDQLDVAHVARLQRSVLETKYLPILAVDRLRTESYRNRLRQYASIVGELYRGIQKVSGCRVIIDSSKVPAEAFVVSEITGVHPKMVHIVRDSRACAFSWQRKKERRDVPGKTEYMPQRRVVRTALLWNIAQTFIPLAARGYENYAVCRYEDLASHPREELARIVYDLGLPGGMNSTFVSDTVVNLGSDHSIQGNPTRFDRGRVSIQSDDEWQAAMAGWHKVVVTSLTLPLLWKHGYLRT